MVFGLQFLVKNILEEFKNGKKIGRVAELVDLKTSKENKTDTMNEYMKKHKNVIVIYNSYSFEPKLYKVTNK